MKWKLNVNVASLLLRVVVVYFIYYYGCMLIVNKWWNSREMQHNNFPFFIEWYNWVYWCGVRRAVVEARCRFLNLGSLMCRRLILPPINLYLRPSLSRSRQLFQLSPSSQPSSFPSSIHPTVQLRSASTTPTGKSTSRPGTGPSSNSTNLSSQAGRWAGSGKETSFRSRGTSESRMQCLETSGFRVGWLIVCMPCKLRLIYRNVPALSSTVWSGNKTTLSVSFHSINLTVNSANCSAAFWAIH